MPDAAKEAIVLLVLACAVFLLLVVPYMLLGLGRLIDAVTNGRARKAAARAEAVRAGRSAEAAAWWRRPMRPAFSRSGPAS